MTVAVRRNATSESRRELCAAVTLWDDSPMTEVFARTHHRPGAKHWARRLGLSLLLSLLLGWQVSALLHSLSHTADGDGSALPQHAHCLLCLAHAGAEGAPLPASSLLAPTLRSIPQPFSDQPAFIPGRDIRPYQVRAPPPLPTI